MSDTGAASWQRMQMMPLTLWSLPPAEALHRHTALPGSSCRCCPYWCVQKFFLLPGCASLYSWCSGECCAATLLQTLFVLLWSATLSVTCTAHTVFFCYFCCAPQLAQIFQHEVCVPFCCDACSIFGLFGMFFLPWWRGCDLFPCPMPVCEKKTFETVTVIKINLTSDVSLIEFVKPTVCRHRPKERQRPHGRGTPNTIKTSKCFLVVILQVICCGWLIKVIPSFQRLSSFFLV